MAHYDNLTDLPNRTLFFDRLQQAIRQAKRDQSILALMFIDLDKFKPINDVHGHAAGDAVLRIAAQRMGTCVRESDIVGRLGGDEFVILLTGIGDVNNAMRVAENIRLLLKQPIFYDDKHLEISSSIGVALFPAHGETQEEIIAHADAAMYASKNEGKDRVQLYQHSAPYLA